MSISAPSDVVQHLQRPGGRIAYSVRGDGPLVVAAPGMGDLRRSYDGLAAALVDAGFRVAVTDVRGHGDSDVFEDQGDEATAGDLLALAEHLGGPAVLVGSSFGGSAAVLAAAERPDLVAGLVLLCPFLREPSGGAGRVAQHLLHRLLFARPWGVLVWTAYYRRMLNRGRRPAGLRTHVAAIRSSMRRPGRLAAFRRLALGLDHSVVELRLGAVRAPALVVVGALDPDYADPAAELAWMADRIGGEALLVDEAAHYPHRQRPDVVLRPVVDFALGLPGRDPWSARD